MNKKGMGLFAFGVFAVVALLMMGMFYAIISNVEDRAFAIAEGYVDSPNATAIIQNADAKYDNWMNGAFLMLFGGIWAAGLLIGYYSEYGKLVLVVMIFALGVLLFVAGGLTNFWDDATTDTDRYAQADELPAVYFVLDNFIIMLLLIIGSALLVAVGRDY